MFGKWHTIVLIVLWARAPTVVPQLSKQTLRLVIYLEPYIQRPHLPRDRRRTNSMNTGLMGLCVPNSCIFPQV